MVMLNFELCTEYSVRIYALARDDANEFNFGNTNGEMRFRCLSDQAIKHPD